MKDFKSFLTGFLLCGSFFLFTSGTLQADKPTENYGKYQSHTNKDNIFLINTYTGEMWEADYKNGHKYWKKIIDVNKIQF